MWIESRCFGLLGRRSQQHQKEKLKLNLFVVFEILISYDDKVNKGKCQHFLASFCPRICQTSSFYLKRFNKTIFFDQNEYQICLVVINWMDHLQQGSQTELRATLQLKICFCGPHLTMIYYLVSLLSCARALQTHVCRATCGPHFWDQKFKTQKSLNQTIKVFRSSNSGLRF
jgi:hypothetical protein